MKVPDLEMWEVVFISNEVDKFTRQRLLLGLNSPLKNIPVLGWLL